MPNSLKCRLKWFVHKGLLSEKDLSRLYTDNDVVEKLEAIKAEVNDIHNWCNPRMVKNDMVKLLDKHIDKLKGEADEK